MGFNKKDLARVREEYSEKYRRAQDESDIRRRELWTKIDGLQSIDHELSMTGMRIMNAAMNSSKEDVRAKIEGIKKNNEKLLSERAALLRAFGYPEDHTDPHYECDKCSDSGYTENGMCECMRRALVLAGYESSGLGELLKTQSFDNFSLDYYKQSPKTFEEMQLCFEKVKSFADKFDRDTYTNLMLFGGTGLGKTHLSTAVAKVVIDKGFDVLYVIATGMISDFGQKRFGGTDRELSDTERYYSADLLIIDDLGTELSNQFSVSCVYEIINARINSRKSTIISTNLGTDEFVKKYWDRTTSRIFGEYRLIKFCGTDVRRQKISQLLK